MSSASSQTPLPHLATFADLLAIPEEQRFHEVLDGEIVQKCMASGEHALGQTAAAAWLTTRFGRVPNGADRPGGWWLLAEVEVELSLHQVVRPDIAGWKRERMPERPRGYPLRLRPDWVCEVMADGDARRRDDEDGGDRVREGRARVGHPALGTHLAIQRRWARNQPQRKLPSLQKLSFLAQREVRYS